MNNSKLIFMISFIVTISTFALIKSALPDQQSQKSNDLYQSLTINGCVSGNPKSKYTVVEFIDYQCPPCNKFSIKLIESAKKYNYRICTHPLPSLVHKKARLLAQVALSQKDAPDFDRLHLELFDIGLRMPESAETFAKKYQLTPESKRDLDSQVNLAKQLKIQATPTILLCKEGDTCINLRDISAIEDIIKKGGSTKNP